MNSKNKLEHEPSVGDWYADRDKRTIVRGMFLRIGQVIRISEQFHTAQIQWRESAKYPNRKTWVDLQRLKSHEYRYLGRVEPDESVPENFCLTRGEAIITADIWHGRNGAVQNYTAEGETNGTDGGYPLMKIVPEIPLAHDAILKVTVEVLHPGTRCPVKFRNQMHRCTRKKD